MHRSGRRQRAGAAGVGATVTPEFGGKTVSLHGMPVHVSGRVRLHSDGTAPNHGPMNTGGVTRRGPTAVMVCGGVEIIATSSQVQALDTGVFVSQPSLRGRLVPHVAFRLSSHVQADPFVRRVHVSEEWQDEAEQLLAQYHDGRCSMRRLGIRDALTFDSDFVMAGFDLVSEE